MSTPMPRRSPRAALLLALALAVPLAIGLAVWMTGRAPADEGPPLRGAFAEDFRLLEQPMPAPGDPVELPDGSEVAVTDFEGEVVLLNFWATWCAPCVREMPSLDRLQAALGDEGLVVMTVSEDRAFAPVEAFFAEQDLRHLGPYLDRSGKLARASGVKGLPTTLLVDRDGQVVGGLQGAAEWDSEDAQALVRWYLARARETELLKTGGGNAL